MPIERIVPCVVLAGGKANAEIQALTGHSNRALVVVDGKSLLRRVVDALASAGPEIGSITVIGDLPEDPAYELLPDTGSFVENLFAGVRANSGAEYVLITTCDLPFLTGEIVAQYVRPALEMAAQTRAGFVWPIVPVASCYKRFPGVKRTSIKLREGAFTGGNLMLVRSDFVLGERERISEVYEARKSPRRLAMMLGIGTVVRLLLAQKISPGFLSIPPLEKAVGRLLGVPARALICELPEIATDIDRASDFEAVGVRAETA